MEAWLHHQGEGRNQSKQKHVLCNVQCPVFLLESVGMNISCHTVLSSLSVRPPGLCERYTSGTRHFLKQYLVLSYLGWFKTIVIKGVQHRKQDPKPSTLGPLLACPKWVEGGSAGNSVRVELSCHF